MFVHLVQVEITSDRKQGNRRTSLMRKKGRKIFTTEKRLRRHGWSSLLVPWTTSLRPPPNSPAQDSQHPCRRWFHSLTRCMLPRLIDRESGYSPLEMQPEYVLVPWTHSVSGLDMVIALAPTGGRRTDQQPFLPEKRSKLCVTQANQKTRVRCDSRVKKPGGSGWAILATQGFDKVHKTQVLNP